MESKKIVFDIFLWIKTEFDRFEYLVWKRKLENVLEQLDKFWELVKFTCHFKVK